MKLKKSIYLILVMIFTITFENNNVYAKDNENDTAGVNMTGKERIEMCYYVPLNSSEDGLFMKLLIYKQNGFGKYVYNAGGTIYKTGKKYYKDGYRVPANWNATVSINNGKTTITSLSDENKQKCPTYVFAQDEESNSKVVYVTNYYSKIKEVKETASETMYYGVSTTKEKYTKKMSNTVMDWNAGTDNECSPDDLKCKKKQCEEMNRLFGPKKGETGYEEGLRSTIDTILGYVRIIVPIIIILLGTIDLAKAVIASKEDEMKKAQNTFIKRLIIGIAVFFVPVFVDIIMDLADIVWTGTYVECNIEL